MKIPKYLIAIFIFNHLSAQLIGESDYSKFAKKLEKIGQHDFKEKEGGNLFTQKITYLGKIISSDNHIYKVLTSHKNLNGKGVNDLVFVSEKGVEFIYRLNLPSDFPRYIENNKLFFKDGNQNAGMEIGILNSNFCSPIECF